MAEWGIGQVFAVGTLTEHKSFTGSTHVLQHQAGSSTAVLEGVRNAHGRGRGSAAHTS